MRHEWPDTLFYMAAVEDPADAPMPAGMESREVAAVSFARFRYSFARLGEVFGEYSIACCPVRPR